jgi:hypothetical protein
MTVTGDQPLEAGHCPRLTAHSHPQVVGTVAGPCSPEDEPRARAFGSVLGIVGLVVLAAGALPHVATGSISDLSPVLLVDPRSPIAVVGILVLIVFHLVPGWSVHSLSRAASGVLRLPIAPQRRLCTLSARNTLMRAHDDQRTDGRR